MKKILDSKYFHIGLTICIVALVCLLFNYLLDNVKVIWKVLSTLLNILMPLIYGLVLAYIMNPIVKFFESKLFKNVKKKSTRRNLSIFVTIIVLIGFLALLFSIVIPQLLESIQSLIEKMPGYLSSFETSIVNWVDKTDLKSIVLSRYDSISDAIVENLNSILPFTNNALDVVKEGLFGVVSFLFNFAIGLVFAIYILANTENFGIGVRKFLYSLFNVEKVNNFIENVEHVNDVFLHFLVGKVCDSFCFVAVCTLIFLLIFNYPYALLIAVMIGLTDLIPYFGPYIGTIPSFLLIFLVSPVKAISFVLFIIILQQIDGNLVTPNIQKQATGLPSFWVLFAITLFGGLFGLVGLLIGVPCFTIIYEICNNFIENKLKKKNLPLDNDFYKNVRGLEKKEVKAHIGEVREKK